MFNLFKKKSPPQSFRGAERRGNLTPQTESTTLKLSGLHCTSCAVNIDLSLEDLPGVIESKTNYQKSESTISYDPEKTNLKAIQKEIQNLGYQIKRNQD